MARYLFICLWWAGVLFGYKTNAQDTLPNFTVENKGNGRIVVSWRNPYPNLIQLAVQRSYDSIKRFGTVYSTTSPELPANGFSDKVPEGLRVYYRIFYVMEGGAYYFTQSKQPGAPVMLEQTITDGRRELLDEDLQKIVDAKNAQQLNKVIEDPNKPIYLRFSDSTGFQTILTRDFRLFRDSIMTKTKDTLVQISPDTVLIRIYDPPFTQKASEYVFTDRDGYIVIKLDDYEKKKYQVVIMDEQENPIINLQNIKEPYLILDKSIFYKAGIFKYLLRENGRVKEKGSVYLPRDF
jgi:hypothetical protein